MNAAVESSKRAFKSWSKTTPLFRQQIMFKFQNLIKENMVTSFSTNLNLNITVKFNCVFVNNRKSLLKTLQPNKARHCRTLKATFFAVYKSSSTCAALRSCKWAQLCPALPKTWTACPTELRWELPLAFVPSTFPL